MEEEGRRGERGDMREIEEEEERDEEEERKKRRKRVLGDREEEEREEEERREASIAECCATLCRRETEHLPRICVALIVSVCLARNTSRSFTCTQGLDFTWFWDVHWTHFTLHTQVYTGLI